MTETALIFAGTTAHCTTSDNVVFPAPCPNPAR